MKTLQWISSRKRQARGVTQAASAAGRDPRAALAKQRPRLLAYLDAWRQAADDLEAASRRWRGASVDELTGAAVAFFAALDREEKAAAAYEQAWGA